MFFKQKVFLILTALFLNTCSMEDQPYPYFVDVGGTSLDTESPLVNEKQIQQCIPKLGGFFSDYFTSSVQTQIDSKKQDSKTDKAFNCIVHTLIYFKRIVKGRSDVSGSFYKSSDLMNFLSTYVFSGKVNEDFVQELLKFKVLFVRGKENVLTEAELTSLIGLVNFEFRRIFKNLETHIPVLNFKVKQIKLQTGDYKEQQKLRNEQAKQIEHAIASFQKEFSTLGDLIEKGYHCKDKTCSSILENPKQIQSSEKVVYKIRSFRNLIREFLIATGDSQTFSDFDQKVDLTKIIIQLKLILFGPPASDEKNDEINQSEWKEIFTFFTSAYSLFIYYTHFSNNLWFVGHKVNQVYDIMLNIINILEKSLKERKKHTSQDSISNETIYQVKLELDNLISNAQEKFNLETDSLARCKKEQKDLFKESWSLVVDVFLDFTTRGKPISGLSSDKISLIKERINLWFIKQKYLEWYLHSFNKGQKLISILDKAYDYSRFLQEKGDLHPKLSKNQVLTYISGNSQSFEFFRELAKNINFGFDSKWRMIVSNKDKDLELTEENIEQKKVALSLLNIESSVAEMFFKKFKKHFRQSFSKEEFLDIFLKKENKLISFLSHFDKKNKIKSTVETLFVYMDLLLLNSDGEMDIDLKELTGFLHFLFSIYNSSISLKNSLERNGYEPIVSDCNELSFDHKAINSYLVENFATEFSNFPNLVEYYNKLSKKNGRIIQTGNFETQFFIRTLWSFTYDNKKNLSYSYISDFITLSGVMHFVEFYMNRWDLDKNSFIDYGETELAYRHFKPTLDAETKDYAFVSGEDIFRYGVFYGELFLGSVNLTRDHPLSSIRKTFYFNVKKFYELCSDDFGAVKCGCANMTSDEYKKCKTEKDLCIREEKNKCADKILVNYGKFDIKTDRESLLKILKAIQNF